MENVTHILAPVEGNPTYALIMGAFGSVLAVSLSSIGAAYGTAKAGTAIASISVRRPDLIMKSLVPVIMSGILAIYGLVIAVLYSSDIKRHHAGYTVYKGFLQFGGGLVVGLTGIAAGVTIGSVGNQGVIQNARQPKLFVGMILILIFGEVLGLYGLILGVIFYAG